jgi:hypothetical protein
MMELATLQQNAQRAPKSAEPGKAIGFVRAGLHVLLVEQLDAHESLALDVLHNMVLLQRHLRGICGRA